MGMPSKALSMIWLFLKKIASPIGVITAIILAVKEIPGVLDFLTWAYSSVGHNGQITLIVIASIGVIYFAILFIKREERVVELKAERDQLEQRLKLTEEELARIEEHNIRMAEEGVKENIWRRDVVGAPPFLAKNERRARFISLLNLKGGVGKTTLAANLGVSLALMDKPLKVLLIDLDFQSTLSNMSVEPKLLLTTMQAGNTASRLLDPNLTPEIFKKQLAIGINKVPNANIAVSDVHLDRMDYQTQAKYFLEGAEDVRFHFRKIFHDRTIADDYDLVIFDCPPRLTTSTVNALTTSDYVLIPTKIDERSFEAIPRTFAFLQSLISIAQPKIIGVIVNEVQYWRKPKPIKVHQNGISRLKELVKSHDPDLYVFDAMVPLDSNMAGGPKSIVPSVNSELRKELFNKAAIELRKRVFK